MVGQMLASWPSSEIFRSIKSNKLVSSKSDRQVSQFTSVDFWWDFIHSINEFMNFFSVFGGSLTYFFGFEGVGERLRILGHATFPAEEVTGQFFFCSPGLNVFVSKVLAK